MISENKCPFKILAEPNGPKGVPLLNSFPDISWNVLKFLVAIRKKYGEISSFKIFGFTSYLVSNPDDISQLFKDEKKGKYTKKRFYKAFHPFFGDGLFNSYGDDWETQRKQLQPYFKKSKIPHWFSIVTDETFSELNIVDKKKISEFDVDKVVKKIMQNIMTRILFGVKPDNKDSKKAIQAIEEISLKLSEHGLKSFVLNGWLNRLPTPGNIKYRSALKTIAESIENITESQEETENHALLPIFSKFMSPKILSDQISTFYFAGQDTTVSTLLWVLYYLAKYPEHQERARQEVLSYWSTDDVNFNALEKFLFLNASIDEAMRLAPAAYLMYRDIEEDIQLGEYQLKKDSLAVISMYVNHRDPGLWENPLEYQPERFLEQRNKGYSFFPYGGGMRICIGMHLARMEITTIVALFLSKFNFELKKDVLVKPVTHITLKPKNGIPLILKPIEISSK